MRRLWAFCLRGSPRTCNTHIQRDPKDTRESMADPRISNGSTEGYEEANAKCAYDDEENIIVNPRFEDGLNSWSGRGCKILLHDSMGDEKILPLNGKVFASATERTQSWNGIQQEITGRVQRKLAYEVTAVVRTFGSTTSSDVRATLWVQAPNGREQYIGIANLQASDKEWVQLQGKFLLNGSPSKVVLYLEGPPPGIDILVNSLVVKHAEKLPPLPPPDDANVPFGVNILQNSNLSDGLNGWFPLGSCTLNIGDGSPRVLPPMARDSLGPHEPLNGRYILVTNRSQTWMGPAQTITDKLKLHLTYQVSAWVRVVPAGSGPQNINVAVGVDSQWVNGGQVEANDDRWHEIGGSFRIEKQPLKVIVYIQGPSSGVDLMVAGLQVFPVDRKARFKHLKNQTDKVRKRDVELKVSGSDTDGLLGTCVKVRQVVNSFPFGSCISRTNIDNEDFVDFFVKNFNWGVFGNELKWYWTEPQQGSFNYADADELLDLCTRNGIETRGHCIFWEVEGAVPWWVRLLNKNDLMTSVQNRLNGLLSRYKGKFRHYDVNNEMLHGSFFQDRLGKDIRSYMFKTTHQLDPSATLFVNDYHVEDGTDTRASPEMYIEQILGLQKQGAPVGGIGIQGHIDSPVGPIVCSALDKLAILGLPIWFTELDVSSANEYVRADDMEVMLREAYAHPAVEGIMLWGFWELFMSRDNAHLVDAEGSVNEAGKRYLALKQEWLSHAHGHIDDQGVFKFRGFPGTYSVEIVTLTKKISQTFVVDKGYSPLEKPREIMSESLSDVSANIILNHDFSGGLHAWTPNSCNGYVVSGAGSFVNGMTAKSGSSYAVTSNRTECWQGLEQDITGRVSPGLVYSVLAWVGVSGVLQGPTEVKATLRLEYIDSPTTYIHAGSAFVTKEQWDKLEGFFSLTNAPERVVFFLEGPAPGVDLLVDSITVTSSIFEQDERTTETMVDPHGCLKENLISNHDFSRGIHSWHSNCCDAYVVSAETCTKDVVPKSGAYYAVITNRKECWQGLEQEITSKVSPNSTYILEAYVRVSGPIQECAGVQATLRLEYLDAPIRYLFVGRASVSKERWERLDGSFSLTDVPRRVVFYLEGPSPGVDLLIDSVMVFSSGLKQLEKRANKMAVDHGDKIIIQNPHFEDGLKKWFGRGCKIFLHNSMGNGIVPLNGKVFASATERSQTWNGIQQDITGRVQRKLAYNVNALVRTYGNATKADVRATLWVQFPNGREEYIGIAKLQASDKEWVQLEGKFLLNATPSKAIIYLEGPPPGTDILVNSLEITRTKKLLQLLPPDFENVLFGINIIENSALSRGLSGWYPLGSCLLTICTGSPQWLPSVPKDKQKTHSQYILATKRTESWMGPAQTITERLRLHLTYQVSAWVRVGSGSSGPQSINVALGVDNEWLNGGQVGVNNDSWHEVAGSFRIEKQPSKVIVYVQGPSSGVDLMVAGLEIYPVDRRARFRHLKEQTDKVRKRDIVLKFSASQTKNLSGTSVKVRQVVNSFPIGSCINRSNIENEEFVDFFVKNFNWAVFGNEMKWYHTEPQPGKFNYTDSDMMLDFCNRHNMPTRGHCIFWEVEEAVQPWVRSLHGNDLMTAVENRLTGLLSRYKGRFKHYDVNNEMLHGSFFQGRLGREISSYMFKRAHQLDPCATLFVNDYHVEDGCDGKSSPEMYIQQILDLREQGAPVGGIGIQGHIDHPVGQVICSALDKLAILGLPIWFTELDVAAVNELVRADDLEVVLREAYAHPAVEGVMLWGFWEMFMCRENSHLVDAEGDINEAGKRYLALKQEWLTNADGLIDDEGNFKFRGFHGTYAVEITTTSKKFSQTFVVDKEDSPVVLNINF